MTVFRYDLVAETTPNLGLIVLQSDQRIEKDFRRLIPADCGLFVSRVPSGLAVTPDSLQDMQAHIPTAAGLLPKAVRFDVIGYGCTSGAAQIGVDRVSALVRQGATTGAVTDPLSALIAACVDLGIGRLALLSPYVETVSNRLRDVLQAGGVQTPVFGTFAEAEEASVARISPQAIRRAALELAGQGGVDAVFLSCTNLDTLDIIAPLEAETGLPVLSSNQVLAWHMCRLAGTGLRQRLGRISKNLRPRPAPTG